MYSPIIDLKPRHKWLQTRHYSRSNVFMVYGLASSTINNFLPYCPYEGSRKPSAIIRWEHVASCILIAMKGHTVKNRKI
jgi:hypothetical protein